MSFTAPKTAAVMKTLWIILLLCCAARAQNWRGGWQGAPLESQTWFADHSWRASRPGPVQYWDLREPDSITIAQGERPFSDFAPVSEPRDTRPLGDVAREYRQQHAAVPKAKRVWRP